MRHRCPAPRLCHHHHAKNGLFLRGCVIAAAFLPTLSSALILEAGQRIPPRLMITENADSAPSVVQPEAADSPQQQQHQRHSLFDLRAVEEWAEERNLKEHHLKTIYQVVMNTNNNKSSSNDDETRSSLEERLVAASFPRRHAADLVSLFEHCTSRLVETYPSVSGGAKLLVELSSTSGRRCVETVLIRHDTQRGTRYTVCVSSQVGCARACTFCATGTMGLLANLQAAEILEQVWIARSILPDPNELRNCVFMGQGEPLDNWSAVHEACRGLTHQCLFGFKAKQVTISTVGGTPERIRQLADEAPQISLAISLHGATQPLRETLMPAARRASLVELEEALDYHSKTTGRRIMVEYLLIDGVNDSAEASDALVRFCLARHKQPLVNLIPYNPTVAGMENDYATPTDERINVFDENLQSKGIQSIVRWTSAAGRDTEGACGQLALSTSSSVGIDGPTTTAKQ